MEKTLKVILIVLLVLALSIGAVLLFINNKLNRINYVGHETQQESGSDHSAEDLILDVDPEKEIREAAAVPEGDIQKEKGKFNIVLIGSDFRIPGTSDRGRGDCTMICSLDMNEGTIRIVSVERAVGVYLPSKGGYDLITHAFEHEGGERVQEAIRECFLIPIEGYVNVDFDALITAVDMLGGIDVKMSTYEAGVIGAWMNRVEDGLYHLNGQQALAFARLRKIDSDFGRVVRQRKVIQGMLDAVKDCSPKELNALINEMLPLINTNLSKGQISKLMLAAPKFLGTTIDSMTIPEENDYWYVKRWDHSVCWGIDLEKYSAVVKDFIR